ncbi:hypothetical protein [Edaphobacter modestus]|uniref:hypothetical protein n=1 Tax=Edaphobacter modestus TaxID=388466 RepID=UPI0013EECD1A|nr:hypothetical protein [Edaphobacter modestus]
MPCIARMAEHTGDGDPENVGGPGTPVSLTFLGGLYSDARLAAFAGLTPSPQDVYQA